MSEPGYTRLNVNDRLICSVPTAVFSHAHAANDDEVLVNLTNEYLMLRLQPIVTLGQSNFYEIVANSQAGWNCIDVYGDFAIQFANGRRRYCARPSPGQHYRLLLVDDQGNPNGSWSPLIGPQCSNRAGNHWDRSLRVHCSITVL